MTRRRAAARGTHARARPRLSHALSRVGERGRVAQRAARAVGVVRVARRGADEAPRERVPARRAAPRGAGVETAPARRARARARAERGRIGRASASSSTATRRT